VAEKFGFSVCTLERLFTQETRLTFTEWTHRMKFIKAMELLNENKGSKEIAFILGYRSTSVFITAFKKYFGISPQVYLK